MNGYTSSGLGGRVPFQPVGSLNVAKVARVDVRLTKNFQMKDRYRAMFTFDAFNLLNHRYFTNVQGREYIETTVAGQGILNPAAGFAAATPPSVVSVCSRSASSQHVTPSVFREKSVCRSRPPRACLAILY